MAGYSGYSKSNNAIDAEKAERYPLTKASILLAEKLNWTQAKTRSFLLSVGTSEWHHSSKFYNQIDYYDVSDEFILENIEEIKSFNYEPKKKKTKELYFKSYNFEKTSDCRKWDWKITNRIGNNCFSFYTVKKEIEIIIKEQRELLKTETRKVQIKIANEKIIAAESILQKIKE